MPGSAEGRLVPGRMRCFWAILLVVLVPCAAYSQRPPQQPPGGIGLGIVWPDDLRGTVRRYLAQEYGRVGEVSLLADVFVPVRSEPVPAVMLIHGGAWAAGTRWQMWLHAPPLLEAGCAVVTIDYRLAPQARFPAQRDDCRRAWRWMVEQADRYGWDPQRMAVYGYSAGAHLALLLGVCPDTDQPSVPRPRAVVAGGAPCSFDWVPPDSRALAYFLGGSPREVPERYHEASPLEHVSADDPPVFLFHGQKDLLVPLASVRRFEQHMKQRGGICELQVYSDSGHLETFLAEAPRRAAVEFLRRYLEPGGHTSAAQQP